MQNKIKINNPQKAELQIATLLFLCPFSGYACGNISFNEPAYGTEKTVTVHIRNIREKIEINPKEPKYLKVVYGLGYKVEKC